jgi:hypothetical protein
VSAPHRHGENFSRVFLSFPQGSPILHSFCTTRQWFSVAIDSARAQSSHSASVRCIEPAGDCGRAGGDRRFSRVNRREGFKRCASARCGKLGRCGLLIRSFLKRWTRAARLRSHCGSRSTDRNLRIKIRDSRLVDSPPAACARNVHSFGNAVSRAYTSPLMRRRRARHSRAMRPRWLAWAAFVLGGARRPSSSGGVGETPTLQPAGRRRYFAASLLSFAFYSL